MYRSRGASGTAPATAAMTAPAAPARVPLLVLTAVTTLLAATGCATQRGSDASGAATGACAGQQTTGITADRIKLGGIYPLSGPASAYGAIPDGVKAYFDGLNAAGGVGGRKIEFTVRDDGYQPPKAVEEARRFVEQEQVFALFQTLGTPSSTAVWDYAGQRKVPQLFVATGASKWGTDRKHPWTMGWQPNYVAEARVYAAHLKKEKPAAKVAALFQNDDFGKDLLGGFKRAIAGSGVRVVAEQSYEVTDPSIDPQMRNLADSKADVLLDIATPKFASQALAADVQDSGWNPLHIVNNVAASITGLRTVGLENLQGVVAANYFKDPVDPQWDGDAEMGRFKAALKKYVPKADPDSQYAAYGWAVASSFHHVLQSMKCPTREGLRDAARNLRNVRIDMLLPGITLNTGADDGFPIESMRMMRLEGERWKLFGEVVDTRGQFGPVVG